MYSCKMGINREESVVIIVFKKFNESINIKITITTVIIVLLGLSIFSFVSVTIFNNFSDQTLALFEDGLSEVSNEYYEQYIVSITESTKNDIDSTFQELYIIGGIIQEYFNQGEAFNDLTALMVNHPYFKDDLVYDKGWYQNQNNEPTTVFVEGYLLNEDLTIKSEVVDIINQTAFLDLLLPQFAKFGNDKIQVYYQGGKLKSFARMAPWKDIGNDIYAVYPELNEQPIWESFSPGIVDQWLRLAAEYQERDKAMEQLSKVSPPNQDGLTGEIILTYSYPLWSDNYNEFEGSIGFDVSINNIINRVEAIQISETGFAFLTLNDGTVFAVNNNGEETLGLNTLEDSTVTSEESSFNVLDRSLSDSRYTTVRNLELADSSDVKIENVTIGDIDYVFISQEMEAYLSWTPSKGFFVDSWTLSFLIPHEEVFSTYNLAKMDVERHYNDMVSLLFLTAVLLVVVTASIITLYNRRVTRKLQALVDVATEIGNRNYDVEIKVTSNDEVGKLSRAFNTMCKEIRFQITKLNVQNETLKREINEHMKKDRMINYLENFDGATDLLNKKALLNILKEVKTQKSEHYSSLIIIGLDEFRKINEAYSFSFGDKALALMAQRLNDFARKNDLAFKLSGDEFALFVRDYTDYSSIVTTVEQLISKFSEPFIINEKEIMIDATFGIATYPVDSPEPQDIFKFATTAMIHGKEVNPGSYTFYDANMNQRAVERLEMISELRNAVKNDELFLLFQPIVDAVTKETLSVEALLRWKSPRYGVVSPNIFIPLAEETRMIIEIGEWVLDHAIGTIASLNRTTGSDIEIAINVSQIQFEDTALDDVVSNLIIKHGFDASKLHLEITESVLISDISHVQGILMHLKETGIKVSIDDFGTGYSSLSYIQTLPISKIKIDRSFIRELHEEKGQAITDIIIDLSKTLKVEVVAEGVETSEQEAYLLSKGCNELQGYLFAKPLELDDLKEYLTNNNEVKR